MEFGAVLQAAQNKSNGPTVGRFYKASFDPPKKESRSKSQLSLNIQKFLAKKEQEEKRKAEEAKRKRDELLAMRDPKMNNKIKKMLKVIKSANKSVLEDAVDNVNTAVTINGPDQPDEDDYGYVSQEASALYTKMMEKYKNIPDEDKNFSKSKKIAHNDLSSTKDRVRAAILKHQEEESLPHKRKRKSQSANNDDFIDDSINEVVEKKPEKPKPKRPPPPPMDFNALLKIAEKKQFEPIVIEPKKPEVEEPERLMTKKQKRELEQSKLRKGGQEKREKERLEKLPNNVKPEPKVTTPVSSSNIRIPKVNDKNPHPSKSNTRDEALKKPQSLPGSSKDHYENLKSSNKQTRVDVNKNLKPSRPDLTNIKSKYENEINKSSDRKVVSSAKSTLAVKKSSNDLRKDDAVKKPHPAAIDPKRKAFLEERKRALLKRQNQMSERSKLGNQQLKQSNQNPVKNIKQSTSEQIKKPAVVKTQPDPKKIQPSNGKTIQKPIPSTNVKNAKPSDVKVRQFPPPDVKVRQFPPPDVKGVRQFPPADVRGVRQFPPPDVRRRQKPPMKRRILDDDSENDSEMDDFIDDGPEDGNDYSKYIKEIFGYDKSRYKDYDEDDANMESNFSQVMKEEIYSTKVGIMEDLEDIQKEKEEKKRKMMILAKRRKLHD